MDAPGAIQRETADLSEENAVVVAPETAPGATPTPEPRVNLGGHLVTVRWVLSWARSDCNICNGGGLFKRVVKIDTALPAKSAMEICACAVGRAQRQLKAHLASLAADPTPIDPPTRAPDAREKERADRKIGGLQRQLTTLEAEYESRRVRFDAGVAALIGEGIAHAAAVQDCASAAIRSSAQVDALKSAIGDTEKRLAELRAALKNEIESTEASERGRVMADAMHKDIADETERRRVRFAKDTEGLRGEIDRARRRLAHAMALYGVTT